MIKISRRGFMASVSTAPLMFSTAVAKEPVKFVQPWVLPWGEPIKDDAIPEPGTVIRCQNGHDYATIISKRGSGEDGSWPVLDPAPSTGEDFPLRCKLCGAVSIAWKARD